MPSSHFTLESPLLLYSSVRLWCASRVPPVRCQSLFLFSLRAPSDFFFTSVIPSTFGSNSQSKGPISFHRLRLGELQISWVLGLSERWKERRWAWGRTGPAQREEQGVKLPFLSPSSWAWQTFKIIKTLPCWTVQFSSVTQSCPTLCDPMNCSTPGLPVHQQHPEFTQTHGHRVSDAIQSSHPLFSPSPPAPNPSQHQSLFQWVNSSHEVARVLEFQLYHHSFQRNPMADSFRMDWLDFLAVQGTFESLLQHHSSKASILQHSAFFTC